MSGATGFLAGLRVVEVADELGEYCGRVLAGLGADVIKVEPPSGEATRRNGPFFEDRPDPDRSLYFWQYNLGKRGIVLDLGGEEDRGRFEDLVATADVVIDARGDSDLAAVGAGYEKLRERHPDLVFCRISPFGEGGPWADWRGSDLVHLALGGVAMNCGYDPDPKGRYETPPIAPQMWQAYHITGDMAAIGILGALHHRDATGKGQMVSINAHQAVSFNTETDVPDWIYQRTRHVRQTCRHSMAKLAPPAIARTKDGRWILPYRTYLPGSFGDPYGATVRLLERHGMAMDLGEEEFAAAAKAGSEAANFHVGAVLDAVVGRTLFDADIWREAQEEGLAWAPSRRPEENLADEHWRIRGTFLEVEHPELGRSFDYVGPRWSCEQEPWAARRRAPLLGEHTDEVLAELGDLVRPAAAGPSGGDPAADGSEDAPSAGALAGIKVLDLSWLLASAGAGRFLASMGAEVVKVEHESRLDAMRFGLAMAPDGGRRERDEATGPITPTPHDSPNRSGAFMEINTGKRAISLNLKSERGKEILTEMIAEADILIEGFSPGTMDRMGFGYERLREINPGIVYVQQSGTGQKGTYGRLRSYGPTAQAFSGISEMSGFPEPYAPAGIGYSYLDWFGAYNVAVAALAGLQRRRRTGDGCWIDAAQVEVGIFLTGTAVLDWSANGRHWTRAGNRSVAKRAAPHGIYPLAGEDRWIAIAATDEEDWRALLRVLDDRRLNSDDRFATLELRCLHEDDLDAEMARATATRDGSELMAALQEAGVAAGVCQTAEDRVEHDPQLRHLGWMTELTQDEIGTWPAKKTPISMSLTPLHTGGPVDRHGPSYGQDTEYVLRRLSGLGGSDIQELKTEGVI